MGDKTMKAKDESKESLLVFFEEVTRKSEQNVSQLEEMQRLLIELRDQEEEPQVYQISGTVNK